MKLRDIEKLHADGLITAEQKEAVIARYKLESRGAGRWLVCSLASLAAMLIVGGAILLAISHWSEITPLVKMSAGMGLLAATWMAYLALRTWKPLTAEALAVVGAGAWLANIVLLGTLFHPGTPAVEGCFVFFAGIVLLPFLARQRLLIGIVALTSIVLYVMMLENETSWLSLSWLQNQYIATASLILLLLLLFWWLLAEKAGDSRGLMKGYFWVGIPAFLGFLSLVQIPLLYLSTPDDFYSIPHGEALYGVAPVLFLIFKPKSAGWFSWLLLAAATGALLPTLEHFCWHPNHLFGLAICGAYALILMFTGTRCGRVAWINYGSVMVFFAFFGLMVDILKSLEESGVVLVISGVALLLLSLLLEQQRRKLVRHIKEKNSTPATEA